MANPNDTLPYPENTRDREENFLGAIAGLNEIPDYPIRTLTRKEMYLKYIAEHGGGGGGGAGVLLGTVDQTSTAFPTTRPDGTALVAGDYVKVSSSATLPFTLGGVTFTTTRDKASWNGTAWVLDAGEFQKTAQTPVSNKNAESYTGTATTQAGINTEVANFIKGLDPDTQIMIETVGDSGTVSDEEIEQITDQTKNVILANDDEIYRLFEVASGSFTFTNVNTETATKVSYKSIYVNVDEDSAGYKTWAKEESVPEVTAEVLDNLIDGSGDITVDLNEDEDTLIIGTHAKIVTISDVPPTAEQGTLTEEQLAALLESTKSVIVFNNEIYFLNDNGHEAGTRGYSHSGVENGTFMLKNITVTLNTRGWVLTTQEVGGGGAVNSVNGKTGTVVLTASDIQVLNSQTIQANLERIDDELGRLQDEKQDLLTAGSNITIDENNVISSTGGATISNHTLFV